MTNLTKKQIGVFIRLMIIAIAIILATLLITGY